MPWPLPLPLHHPVLTARLGDLGRYNGHVDGHDHDSGAVRVWRTLATSVLKPALAGFFQDKTEFTKRLSAFEANGKFEDPANGRTLRSLLDGLRADFGADLKVYCWHTLGGYWGGVSVKSPKMQHVAPFEHVQRPTRSMLEVEPQVRARALRARAGHVSRGLPPCWLLTMLAYVAAHAAATTHATTHAITHAITPPPLSAFPKWQLSWDAASLCGVGAIGEGRELELFHGIHGYLAASGVDGVKIDAQSGMVRTRRIQPYPPPPPLTPCPHRLYHHSPRLPPRCSQGPMGQGVGGGPSIVKRHVNAMEASVDEHFEGNRCINCMCHSTENLYQYRSTSLLRAADDFYPEEPASQPAHLANVCYNSVFLGEVGYTDWDMFTSTHVDAGMHAAARAVGGAQIYVSDKPGQHDFDLLRQLVLPDGSTLVARHAGRPTRDTLFSDVNADGVSPLKIWNENAMTGIIGVFNAQVGDLPRSPHGSMHLPMLSFALHALVRPRPSLAAHASHLCRLGPLNRARDGTV